MSYNLLRNNLTIKISSSLNADYIFDKKPQFYGVLCALRSSIFLFTNVSISFSVVCFI